MPALQAKTCISFSPLSLGTDLAFDKKGANTFTIMGCWSNFQAGTKALTVTAQQYSKFLLSQLQGCQWVSKLKAVKKK